MRRLRIGVAGVGMIAQKMHLPNLARMPEAEVVALWSRRAESLEAGLAVLRGGAPSLYHDYARFLSDAAIEAVLISAPDNLHEQMFLEALSAGKHVYLEKPPAITVEGNRRVLAAAHASDRVTMIGLQNRYSSLYIRAADLLREGAIGPLRVLSCKEYRVPFLPKPGNWILTRAGTGGSLLVKCIHFLDAFNWYAGGQPERIVATGGHGVVAGQETLDHAWVLVDYANGVQACLGMVLFAPRGERVEFELIGDRGRLALDVERQELRVETAEGVRTESTAPEGEHFHPGSRLALEDFVSCALSGGVPRASLKVGVDAALIALAAEQSVTEGQPVTMSSLALA